MSAAEIEPIDLHHLGRERVICCWRVDEILVDPGPGSTVETLTEALGDTAPRAVLATHIHLDHAGGIGSLVRRWPDLTVYVHEIGAPHLANPEKLLSSAERLYGDRMEELWGEVLPVPEENLVVLSGGEAVEGFDVIYTPGHASHHVSYMHGDSGTAFVGDTAGVRIAPAEYVLTPTPPPDIDLKAWEASLQSIEEWGPSSLAITHFGRFEDIERQLAALREGLALNRERVERDDSDRFVELVSAEIAAASDSATAAVYDQAAPLADVYAGLERYLRKQAEVGGG